MSVEGSAWVLGTSDTQRKFIAALVYESQPGWVVSIEPPTHLAAVGFHSANVSRLP